MDLAANWLQPLFAAWIDVALATSVGIAVVRDAVPALAAANLARLARRTGVVLGLGLAAYLAAATMAMTDTDLSGFPGSLWLVLTQSDFGSMIWVALAAWIALMMAARLPQDRTGRLSTILCLAGLIVFSYARAATGHAADHGFLSPAVAVHTIHILAACAWAGSVGVCVLSTRTWRDWPAQRRSALAHRLSTTATIAVPAVVASGLLNVARTVGHSAHPWGTAYLDLLITKVALVGVAVVLGSWNRWSWMARLDSGQEQGARGFVRVLLIEAVVLIAVLVLAAKLGTTMLPK